MSTKQVMGLLLLLVLILTPMVAFGQDDESDREAEEAMRELEEINRRNAEQAEGAGIMIGMPWSAYWNMGTLKNPMEVGTFISAPYQPSSAGYYTLATYAEILFSVISVPIDQGMEFTLPVGGMLFLGIALPSSEEELEVYESWPLALPMGVTANVRPQVIFGEEGSGKLAVGLDIAVGPQILSPHGLYWHAGLVLGIGM